MEQESPKNVRRALIETAVNDALVEGGRHWDIAYSGVEGIRPDTEIPPESWEQFPRLGVAFGERLLSRESILEHEQPGWLAMQIATDLIWISGFTLVGSRIEHGPKLIAPYLRRCLERTDTDLGRFDTQVLESHNRWCYCAREIGNLDEPFPLYYATAADSTLKIASLVLDLGLEQDLFSELSQTASPD